MRFHCGGSADSRRVRLILPRHLRQICRHRGRGYGQADNPARGRQLLIQVFGALQPLLQGTYEVGDGTLTITNSEGKHYVFTVKDDTLIYKADSSDSLDLEETDEPLKDGTVFELRNAIKS